MIHPAPINSGLFQYLVTLKHEIQEIIGIYSLQQGDPSGAPDTWRGTLTIDEFGNRRIQSKRDDIYKSIARAGKIALDFATVVYDPSKIIRVTNTNGNITVFQIQDYSKEALEFTDPLINDYDVIVVAGSTMPSNRWAEMEMKSQMFQMGILDREAVLKSTDLPDAEGILQRTGEVQQMQQAMQQMEQEREKIMQEREMLLKQLEESEMGEEAKAFANELKISLEKEKAQIEADEEIRNLKMSQHNEILSLERSHQKQLMQMERRIKTSKQKT